MARSILLVNDSGSPWTIDRLGGIVVPASGTLDVTEAITDPELATAIQNGLGDDFDSTHYLRVGGIDRSADASKNFLVPGQLGGTIMRPSNVVYVAKDGGEYESVKDAVESITGATASSPWSVLVSPGTYTESPFTVPSYVTVVGFGQAPNAIIETDDNNADFIELEDGAGLKSLTVKGPTGTGYTTVRNVSEASNPAQCEDVVLTAGYYGFRVTATTTRAVMICTRCAYSFGGSVINRLFSASGKATLITSACGASSPVDGYIGTGYYVSGADAQLSAFDSSYGDANGTGFYIDSGAYAFLSGCRVSEGSKGIHVGPNGSGTTLDAAGCSIDSSVTNSGYIESVSAVVRFTGSADKNTYYVVPGATVAVNMLDTTSGEEGALVLGELWLGGPGETIPLRRYGLDTYLTGHVTGGVTTRGTGRAVDVALGNGFVNEDDNVAYVEWDAETDLSVPEGSFHVYVTAAGVVTAAAALPDLRYNILLASGYSESTSIVLLISHTLDITHRVSKHHVYAEEAFGNICASGCQATKSSTALKIDVESGKYYHADQPLEPDATDDITFAAWYRDNPTGWKTAASQTVVDPDNYDDGSGTLASMPTGKWKKDLLYIAVGGDGVEYHLVYAQEYFDSQALAEGGDNPAPPDSISNYCLRVAGIVTEEGGTVIASIVDARPFIGQSASGSTAVTVHGNLTGLAADDHTQYLLGSGARAMTGSLDMGANAITNVGNVDGVDVSGHASRHNPEGADAVTTAAPVTIGTANAEGDAASLARSNHVHNHGNQGGGALHAEATTSVSGFMSAADKTKLNGISVGVFGSNYQTANSAGQSSTTSADWQTKLTLTTPGSLTGTFRIGFTCRHWQSGVADISQVRLYNVTDGVVVLGEFANEPEDADDRFLASGFAHVAFTGSAKTFRIEYRQQDGGTAYIDQAWLEFWRVA